MFAFVGMVFSYVCVLKYTSIFEIEFKKGIFGT